MRFVFWGGVRLLVIMGIDPGLATVGCGVVDFTKNRFTLFSYGAVRTEAHTAVCCRLEKIYDDITELIQKFKPEAISIEKIFFNSNQKTAIDVSQARGVCVLAAQKNQVPVFEYTPLQVKQSVVGYGRAQKCQVEEMVKVLLALSEIPKPDDAADALALAICHAHTSGSIMSYLRRVK